jgi:hypothetical protein
MGSLFASFGCLQDKKAAHRHPSSYTPGTFVDHLLK